jgi:deoxyribonuclease-4
MLIGIHINDDIFLEAIEAKNLNYNLVQLFVNSSNKKYNEFNLLLQYNKIKCVVHAAYSINIGREWDHYSFWINQLIHEIELAHKIGSFGIVVHMGKQLNLTKEQTINNMYSCLLYVHNKTKMFSSVKIILETPAGQGTEMCYKLEDLANFYKKFSHNKIEDIRNRFRICIDTCHIFAAGYDIRTKGAISMYLDTFEEMIGLRHVALIHLNDSKNELGSKKDRHENIGKGFIGSIALKYFVDFFSNINVPIILETPANYHKEEMSIIQN